MLKRIWPIYRDDVNNSKKTLRKGLICKTAGRKNKCFYTNSSNTFLFARL